MSSPISPALLSNIYFDGTLHIECSSIMNRIDDCKYLRLTVTEKQMPGKQKGTVVTTKILLENEKQVALLETKHEHNSLFGYSFPMIANVLGCADLTEDRLKWLQENSHQISESNIHSHDQNMADAEFMQLWEQTPQFKHLSRLAESQTAEVIHYDSDSRPLALLCNEVRSCFHIKCDWVPTLLYQLQWKPNGVELILAQNRSLKWTCHDAKYTLEMVDHEIGFSRVIFSTSDVINTSSQEFPVITLNPFVINNPIKDIA